MTEVGTG